MDNFQSVVEKLAKQTQKAINDLAEKTQTSLKGISEQVQQLQGVEMERQEQEYLERYIKVITATYSSAKAYTNLIIIAGYAAFFTMWSFTRETLNDVAAAWAALLMMISATAFVIFETYKMIWIAHKIKRSVDAIDNSPQHAVQQLKELEQVEHKETMQFGKIWIVILIITIPTAIIAVSILAISFVLTILPSLF